MACYHPLTAIIYPDKKTVNGKKLLRVVSEEYATLWSVKNGPEKSKDCIIKLPCGQCAGCRIQYSREWANRCMMELQDHDSAFFVTLTYDDKHVPISYYPDPETGEVCESMTLYKRDFQLFMKRLRKKFSNDKIRFFMAGEYGSETYRPHYHAIIFGLHLDDLKLYKKSPQGFSYFNSESLQSCWIDTDDRYLNNPNYKSDGKFLGYAVAAEVTWETCAYTARYVMKKLKGKQAEFYETFNLVPEFTLMSRKPGIARNYYETHPKIYDYDFINISTEKGGIKFRPPHYFDKLFDIENPEELERIKKIRQKFAIESQKAKLEKTTLYPEELLAVEEMAFENKIKSLRRNIV